MCAAAFKKVALIVIKRCYYPMIAILRLTFTIVPDSYYVLDLFLYILVYISTCAQTLEYKSVTDEQVSASFGRSPRNK
jgi:hypothetical protein